MSIETNLSKIQADLTEVAKLSPLATKAPTLIAVSKTHPAEAIRPALQAGHHHFGENKVQEASKKWPDLRTEYPETTLHLIGPLQSNKSEEAVALFDVIHTLDREKLAKTLQKAEEKLNLKRQYFVQVNTGEESQKAGIAPDQAESFIDFCREETALDVVGLMCLPPLQDLPGPHFAYLRTLADKMNLSQLSMGMSADYEEAIRFGATHIRVGTAIFGQRPPQAV